MDLHHINPRKFGGTDNYRNLVLVTNIVHKLIHATKLETINKYLSKVNLNEIEMNKLNKLRKKAGNIVI